MFKGFDYMIVGAGFAGAVLAERLASVGKSVVICDRRPHIGGNAYDYYDDHGILIHKYGPHIFHTNSREVFMYLSRFTKWRAYEHRVLAAVDGLLVPIPINSNTVEALYGVRLFGKDLEAWYAEQAVKRSPIVTSEDAVVSKVGQELYEKFFKSYTTKQWGVDPAQLDASVCARIPTRTNRDNRYFSDDFQAMPRSGYTRLFENILDHDDITVVLNCDWKKLRHHIRAKNLIYTGPIDKFYDYRLGKLPYRSLEFRFETHMRKRFQPVAVVNYPNSEAYTRITEYKHLTGQEHGLTTISYEYPRSDGDPYYPVPRAENQALYQQYKSINPNEELLDNISGDVHFVGRLATYRYYNMDQVVAQALTLFARLIKS